MVTESPRFKQDGLEDGFIDDLSLGFAAEACYTSMN